MDANTNVQSSMPSQPNSATSPQLPPQTKALRVPWLVRTIGVLAILMAIVGVGLGGVGYAGVTAIQKFDLAANGEQKFRELITPMLEQMPPEERAKFEKVDLSEYVRMFSSPEFYQASFFYLKIGAGFNLFMIFLGVQLCRLKRSGVWVFMLLMAAFGVYFIGYPIMNPIQMPSWIIGNVGTLPVALTFFWVWGSLLVLIGGA